MWFPQKRQFQASMTSKTSKTSKTELQTYLSCLVFGVFEGSPWCHVPERIDGNVPQIFSKFGGTRWTYYTICLKPPASIMLLLCRNIYYVLFMYYLCTIYVLFMYYLCTIYVLFMYYFCTIFVLFMYYLCTIWLVLLNMVIIVL